MITVRGAEGREVAAAERLAAAVFSSSTPGPRPGALSEHDRVAPAVVADPGELRVVAVDDGGGAVVGTVTVRLRGQWFGGARLLGAAVSSVAVDPAHRGRGLGGALLESALEAAAASGAVVAALVPSTHRFYRAHGFGVAGRRPVHALRVRELLADLPRVPRGGAALVVRPTAPDDAAAVADLVERRAAVLDGTLDHRRLPGGPAEDVSEAGSWVLERGGRVTGWCVVHRRPPSVPGATYDGVVRDLVGETPDDEVALWRYAVADVPAAPLVEALVLPGGLLEESLERLVAPVEDGTWMLRLLDPAAALAQRGYAPGTTAEVRLRVTGSAGGPVEVGLGVGSGRARTGAVAPDAPVVELGLADLGSVFTGHLDPVRARARGRIACDAATAALLRGVFAGPPAVLTRAF
ncbi:GNAT family N-acetyltransferase [Quadrisphaera sp. INWT6]|uniref:GNAT family N-acetyltransferase n=1 Tax=Quadrisphaera sp. INWT6 TaxID=2596917 RepID=UPI001892241D|nr:GNAT family N-acetyltransferase [Quadrisphaera sp. INWT6]MBF5082238.1 GNAT family N-acetyltransferase [Quadrisphaera sp. INWT6]